MKPRAIGIAIMVTGVLLILTPWVIFPVCGVGRHAPPWGITLAGHGCHQTLKALTALGFLVIVVGVVPTLWPRKKIIRASAVITEPLAFLIALIPYSITGMCMDPTMPCNLGTTPAVVTVAILMAGVGIAGILISKRMP